MNPRKTLVCLIAAAALFAATLSRPAAADIEVIVCISNLKNIQAALQLYAADHAGRFPARLADLVPKYMKSLPRCRATGTDTFSASYASNGTSYRVCCQGKNHGVEGIPPDHPGVDSQQGLLGYSVDARHAAGGSIIFPETPGVSRYAITVAPGWVKGASTNAGVMLNCPSMPGCRISLSLTGDPGTGGDWKTKLVGNMRQKAMIVSSRSDFRHLDLEGMEMLVTGTAGTKAHMVVARSGRAWYLLMLSAPAAQFDQLDSGFASMLKSLRPSR